MVSNGSSLKKIKLVFKIFHSLIVVYPTLRVFSPQQKFSIHIIYNVYKQATLLIPDFIFAYVDNLTEKVFFLLKT